MVCIAFRAGRVEVDLGARIDRRDFDLYEKKLKEVRQQVAKKEQFKAQLGGDYDARAFNAYQRELKRTERSVNDNIKAQGRLRTAFGNVYGRGGAIFAAAGGLYAFQAAGRATIGTASDISESLSKNQQLFGKYAKQVETFSKASAVSFGVSRKAALEYTGVFGNLFRGMGITQKSSSDLSVQLVKLASDMASFNNTSIEQALEAIRAGVVGESEPLRKYGVNINEAALKAEALASGLVKVTVDQAKMKSSTLALDIAQTKLAETLKKHGANSTEAKQAQLALENAQQRVNKAAGGQAIQLNAQQKAMAAVQLTTKQTAAAHGDFARTSGGLANQTRILQARFSDIQGQIGEKLLPVVLKITQATNKFIGEMQSGRGAGGRFADQMQRVGEQMVSVGKTFGDVAVKAHGHESTILKLAAAYLGLRGRIVAAGAALVAAIGIDKAKQGADSIDDVRKRIAQLTAEGNIKGLRQLGDTLRTVGTRDARAMAREVRAAFGDAGVNGALNQAQAHFADFRRSGSNDMKGIRKATNDNMHFIRRVLGEDSKEGREALAKNFRLARTAIRTAMEDGTISVKEGLAEIRKLMRQELKQYGITGGVATAIIKHGDIKGGGGAGSGKAAGGWIGRPGMIGGDIIPAMLAPGEAVLNRHQQAVIEGMLGDGFLDRLFEVVDRPHYFAGGGFAGAVAAANQLDRAHFPYRWGGGHQATPAPFGPMDCSGAVSYVLQHAGINVPTSTSGQLANMGSAGSGPITVYANTGHTFMRLGSRFFGTSGQNPGGGAGFFGDPGAGYIARFAQRTFGAGGPGFSGDFGTVQAPGVSGSGMLPTIVRAALGAAAGGANRYLNKRIGSLGIGTGDVGDAGPGYSKGQLSALWKRAGGPENVANIMAAIALAESGGDPTINYGGGHNSPLGQQGKLASGLWQILGLPFPGNVYDPLTNARMAVAKYGAQGFRAWEAYTKGTYKSYLSRGGRALQFFAKGGKAGGSKRKKIKKKPSAAEKARDYIRPLASLQTDRIGDWDIIQGNVDDWNTRYGLAERTYDLDVEELITDDGSIDEAAIRERGNELLGLISIRQQIIRQLVAARAVAQRVVRTYNRIISRLRRSLKHAGKKSRASIRETIGTYTERRDEWKGKLHELNISTLPSARLDLRELVRERGEVLGTKAEPADISDTDTGAGDLGGTEETGGADTTTDTTTAPPSAADIAAAAIQEYAVFLQSSQEALGSYTRNFITAFQATSPGGVFSGTPEEIARLGGTRYLGAGSTGGLGGATINNYYAAPPDNPHVWSDQMRFQLEAA